MVGQLSKCFVIFELWISEYIVYVLQTRGYDVIGKYLEYFFGSVFFSVYEQVGLRESLECADQEAVLD